MSNEKSIETPIKSYIKPQKITTPPTKNADIRLFFTLLPRKIAHSSPSILTEPKPRKTHNAEKSAIQEIVEIPKVFFIRKIAGFRRKFRFRRKLMGLCSFY